MAVLRAVAGIEKKRSILVGIEKVVVARHEVRWVGCGWGGWGWAGAVWSGSRARAVLRGV